VVPGWPPRGAEIAYSTSARPEIDGADWRPLEGDNPDTQRLRTLGGHLVTEEGELACSEGAIRRVNNEPIPLKLGEGNP
jgi:hypothetical protein